jgi:hypothetical protein
MTDKSIEYTSENKMETEDGAKEDEKIESGATTKKTPTKKSPRKPPQKKNAYSNYKKNSTQKGKCCR